MKSIETVALQYKTENSVNEVYYAFKSRLGQKRSPSGEASGWSGVRPGD